MDTLLKLLDQFKSGKVSKKALLDHLRQLPFERFGTVTFDSHREIRTGLKEVVYAPGKTRKELVRIVKCSIKNHSSALVTRADDKTGRFLKNRFPGGEYHGKGGVFTFKKRSGAGGKSKKIAVVTAGVADENVAEEAALTLEHQDLNVERIYDVGVAGIHRLLGQVKKLEAVSVIIVVAGMEGALASVVAGLTSRPVIAVPTSTGYGASFKGIAPLLTMLNSCAGGVAVVNIDSGFNAACVAYRICNSITEMVSRK